MIINKKIILLLTALVSQVCLFAQQNAVSAENSNSFMRSEGKIYVVMTVALTILIGLFLFVLRLDKKISLLEKK